MQMYIITLLSMPYVPSGGDDACFALKGMLESPDSLVRHANGFKMYLGRREPPPPPVPCRRWTTYNSTSYLPPHHLQYALRKAHEHFHSLLCLEAFAYSLVCQSSSAIGPSPGFCAPSRGFVCGPRLCSSDSNTVGIPIHAQRTNCLPDHLYLFFSRRIVF